MIGCIITYKHLVLRQWFVVFSCVWRYSGWYGDDRVMSVFHRKTINGEPKGGWLGVELFFKFRKGGVHISIYYTDCTYYSNKKVVGWGASRARFFLSLKAGQTTSAGPVHIKKKNIIPLPLVLVRRLIPCVWNNSVKAAPVVFVCKHAARRNFVIHDVTSLPFKTWDADIL